MNMLASFFTNIRWQDILDILDAHTQSYEIRGDAGCLLFGFAKLFVGGGRRVNHQTFSVADIGQMADQLQVLDEFDSRIPAALDAETTRAPCPLGRYLSTR